MKTINQIRFPLLVIALCLTSIGGVAQPVSDFERWKKEEQEKFQVFKDERDRVFVEFLKRHWREMQMIGGIVPDETPKPTDMPVYTPPPDTPPDTTPDESPIIEEIPTPQPPAVEQPPQTPPEVEQPPPPTFR